MVVGVLLQRASIFGAATCKDLSGWRLFVLLLHEAYVLPQTHITRLRVVFPMEPT